MLWSMKFARIRKCAEPLRAFEGKFKKEIMPYFLCQKQKHENRNIYIKMTANVDDEWHKAVQKNI